MPHSCNNTFCSFYLLFDLNWKRIKCLLVIRVRTTMSFNRSNSTIVGSTNCCHQENTFLHLRYRYTKICKIISHIDQCSYINKHTLYGLNWLDDIILRSSSKLYLLRTIIPLCTLLILDQNDQNFQYVFI